MDTAISFFSEYTLLDLFVLITMFIVCVRGIERAFKWIADKLRAYYKHKRGIEETDNTIASHTKEIQALTERIDRFTATVEHHYNVIIQRVDGQQGRLEEIDREGKRRDCAVLRDRILAGMRYFSQNKDAERNVHIAISDFENMNAMFTEYFKAGGNGFIKVIYEEEFLHFIIDR